MEPRIRFRPTVPADLPIIIGWAPSAQEFAQWCSGEFRYTWPVDFAALRADFARLTDCCLTMWTGVNSADTPIATATLREELDGRQGRFIQAMIAPTHRARLGIEFLLRSHQTARDTTGVDRFITMPQATMVDTIAVLTGWGYRATGVTAHPVYAGRQVDLVELACPRERLRLPEDLAGIERTLQSRSTAHV